MAGLDKIIKQILDDASSEASEITAKANQEAVAIEERTKEECSKIIEEGKQRKEALTKAQEEKSISSAQLRKRQLVLQSKQQLITETLDKAYEALLKEEDSSYFAMIKKMLEKFAQAKAGEICFSRKDLDRMPSDFETEISQIAERKGGSLRLSEDERQIDGGFILVYGGIEENCSFKALISARKDELSDKVQQILF